MMKRIIQGLCLCTILALGACVTGGPTAKRRIIDQTAGVEETPKWVSGKNKFDAEDKRIGFKGYLTMESDSRPDACTHAAAMDAKGRISSLIASSIMDESGISGDEKTIGYNRLVAVLSKQKLPGLEIADEFWSLVEIDDGDNATRRLECWAKVTIEKKVFDKAMEKSLAELSEDKAVTKHRQRLEDAQEKMQEDEALAH